MVTARGSHGNKVGESLGVGVIGNHGSKVGRVGVVMLEGSIALGAKWVRSLQWVWLCDGNHGNKVRGGCGQSVVM